ncbi:FecR domain-containing protein [Aeoliella mucimassa]|uniref:FecR protein n=1 Tax=Aeoliella mucimassa TaxID=2527972 RepID=A0A518AJX8_9BACT|nr:FecR domain-containing protein [Aeoliella mucimassa]QDU55033.1 FecR protein [Aeoliella mucimassa]
METSSTNHPFDENRLVDLALASCSGAIAEEEVQELSALLTASPHARMKYFEVMAVHTELEWSLRKNIQTTMPPDCDVSLFADLNSVPSKWEMGSMWRLGIAASLLAVICCVLWLRWRDQGEFLAGQKTIPPSVPVETVNYVGTITPLMAKVDWTVGRSNASHTNEVLQGDTLWLREGAIELRMVSNAVAVLESPVIMQIVSADRIRMIDGDVMINVPSEAEGFTIESEAAEVLHLGAECSVGVEAGSTNVVVFDGDLELRFKVMPNDDGAKPREVLKKLRAGEAVQVTRAGTLSRIVDVQRLGVGRHAVDKNENVIASVTDNNVREDLWSFYEIVPNGLQEDALAYVDRPSHEWNGVTAAGIPEYLIGAELVKTFNNDKMIGPLNISLTLAQPAIVYVFLDERITTPEWLVESFENTGDEIGLDEGEFLIPGSGVATDVGPGKSIERRFSVWRKVMPKGGVANLGPNGPLISTGKRHKSLKAGANMYGVAAVPLTVEPTAPNR